MSGLAELEELFSITRSTVYRALASDRARDDLIASSTGQRRPAMVMK